MTNLFFFFTNKERFKFLMKCLIIGVPMLLLAAWALTAYEDREAEKGTANDKGGISYYYRGSGTDNYPEPVARLIPVYPNSKTTYINVSTDKNQELEGDILAFTPDALGKVIAFYKQKGKLIEASTDYLAFEINRQNISISKENSYDDDPIKGETKFEIRFNTKATVDKWKNFKP